MGLSGFAYIVLPICRDERGCTDLKLYTFIDIPVIKYQREFTVHFALTCLFHHQLQEKSKAAFNFGTREPGKPGSILGGGRLGVL